MAQKKVTGTQKPISHMKTPSKIVTSNTSKVGKNQKSMLTWLIPVAVLAIALILYAIFSQKSNTPSSANTLPANISVTEAAELFEAGAFMLDVRTPAEWNENHVDGAVLIPLDQLSSRIDEIPTDQDVLIICRSGNRSTDARNILRAANLPRTTSVIGGINAWMAENLPVVTGP